jgi:hypothetical protein
LEKPFREIVGQRFEGRLTVRYAFQEINDLPAGFTPPPNRTKPWGTGHAVLAGESAMEEPFVAINADDFYGAESFRLLAQFLSAGNGDFAMAGFRLRNTLSDFGTVSRGICQVGPGGLLQSVEEMTRIERDGRNARNTDSSGKITPLGGDEIVSMNFWGFTPGIFPALRAKFAEFLKKSGAELKSECYLPSVVSDLIAEGKARVEVLPTDASWFGVTYQEDRPRVVASVRQLVAQGDYPERLWS